MSRNAAGTSSVDPPDTQRSIRGPKLNTFIMFYDLDAELWYKCKVIKETRRYIQLSYCGWGDNYEKPWVEKDSDRIDSMKSEKGKWKNTKVAYGAWKRLRPSNEPSSIKRIREAANE